MENTMTLEEQYEYAQKQYFDSSNTIFKFEEGDNKIRILSLYLHHPIATHFLGKNPTRAYVCYGADEGCRYHGENSPVDEEGNPKAASIKFVAYVLNMKDKNPRIQRADLVNTIVKKVMKGLKNDEDYAFESFPMPYDLKIKYDTKAAGSSMYEITPVPKREEVAEEVLAKLATQKPLANVVDEAMARAKNANE